MSNQKVKTKPKPDADKELNESLKDSFPASDPSSGNQTEKKPVRPVDRKPAKIDKELVDRLAKEVDKKQRQLDRDDNEAEETSKHKAK